MRYLIFFALLICNPVLGANLFEPPADDLSMKILGQFFGGLLDGGNDMFGSSMAIFNGGILLIGGIFAGYTILAGTLGTAHDGEMLGKKFSSVWIPIRYSLGTALVIPISSSGYCGMQMLVMWAITQGVGLAGNVWSEFMKSPTQSANVAYSTIGTNEITRLAENAFTASVCVAAYNRFVSESDPILGFQDRYKFEKNIDKYGNYNYGYVGNGGVSKHVCGHISTPHQDKVKNVASQIPNQELNNVASTNNGYLGILDDVFKPVDITPLNAIKSNALKNLIDRADTLAQKAVADKNIEANASSYRDSLDLIAESYVKEVEGAARKLKQVGETKEQKYGWMLAGAYFNNIVLSNNAIHDSINSYPVSRASRALHFGTIPDDDIAKYLVANDVLDASSEKAKSGATANSKTDGASGGNDSGFGVSSYVGNFLAEAVSDIDLHALKNDTRHPIIIVNEMGNQLLQSYATVITATAVANFGAGFAKELATGDVATVTTLGGAKAVAATASGTLSALSAVGNYILIPLTALLFVGFLCAYLIPILPFIYWLACIGGYFIQTVIAVIVAPLWAVMHLHPNGDDLTGKGGDGYSLLMGLLLRPTFLIFGFIASIVMSSILGEFINKVFFSLIAFSGANVNGWMAFLTMIFGVGIYAFIMFAFIKKTHSIMFLIPDEIFKWIGGGKDGLGSYAQDMVGGVERSGSAGASALGGFLGASKGVDGKNISGALGKGAGGLLKSKDTSAVDNQQPLSNVSSSSNGSTQNDYLNSQFGDNASQKKEQALGFSSPNGFSEQTKSAKYDSAMQSVKDVKGFPGVESYQNEVIKYANDGNALNETAFNNIAESIKRS